MRRLRPHPPLEIRERGAAAEHGYPARPASAPSPALISGPRPVRLGGSYFGPCAQPASNNSRHRCPELFLGALEAEGIICGGKGSNCTPRAQPLRCAVSRRSRRRYFGTGRATRSALGHYCPAALLLLLGTATLAVPHRAGVWGRPASSHARSLWGFVNTLSCPNPPLAPLLAPSGGVSTHVQTAGPDHCCSCWSHVLVTISWCPSTPRRHTHPCPSSPRPRCHLLCWQRVPATGHGSVAATSQAQRPSRAPGQLQGAGAAPGIVKQRKTHCSSYGAGGDNRAQQPPAAGSTSGSAGHSAPHRGEGAAGRGCPTRTWRRWAGAAGATGGSYQGMRRPKRVHGVLLMKKPTKGSVMASQARPTNRMMEA